MKTKRSEEKQTALLIVFLLFLFLLTNCAPKSEDAKVVIPGECDTHALIGKWINNGETLEFKTDCTGVGSFCSYEFKYPITTLKEKHTTITFTKSNSSSSCIKAGDKLINIELYNKGTYSETLLINDGSGEYIYKRAKQ